MKISETDLKSRIEAIWEPFIKETRELCAGQANRAWFLLRKYVITSSTAFHTITKFLPKYLKSENKELKECAEKIARYLQFTEQTQQESQDLKIGEFKSMSKEANAGLEALEKLLTGPAEEKKTVAMKIAQAIRHEQYEPADQEQIIFTSTELDKMTQPILGLLIDYRNHKRKVHKINKGSNKAQRIQNIIHAQEQEEPEYNEEESLFLSLLNTWSIICIVSSITCLYGRFLPPIREGEKSALRAGRLNEPKIRSALRQHLLESNLLLLDHREFGLLEKKEHPEICTSSDDVGVIFDPTAEQKLALTMFELKTVTNTETRQRAENVFRKYGRFTTVNSNDEGI